MTFKPPRFRQGSVVEGKLAGPCVEELKRCWQGVTCSEPGRHLLVDLSAMTFVDLEGKALLAEMHRRGAMHSAVGLLTQAIIEEVTRSL